MNFFAQQDRARHNTAWLVVCLILAVIGLIVITTLAVAIFVYLLQNGGDSYGASQALNTPMDQHFRALLTPQLVGSVAAIVLIVVVFASLYKLLQLNRGGKEVAEALGGRLINTDTRDPDERKILNVVEEMAIASGNPVPSVYLLEEPGINAFAAGFGRHDAVIGITRGCIQQLNRDELQGVIAHEFSHIHFGDMRLNMRLIALLHGILVIGLIGYFVLRSAGVTRRKNAGAQLALGLALIVIGYCGTLFGNIIKAAVSRQREFLADASAVQFTRNPSGIANALKKIGGWQRGSKLEDPHASEYSHLYFANGISQALGSVLATHPPLQDRIKRIDPRWNGRFIETGQQGAASRAEQTAASQTTSAGSAEEKRRAYAGMAVASAAAEQPIDEQVGNPTPEHITYAHDLLEGLPHALSQAVHEPYSARALIYALLLDSSKGRRENQLSHLHDRAHPATFKVLEQLYPLVSKLHRRQYLPLLELAIPALKQLSAPQYKVFKDNLTALIRADKKVSLFEWALYRTLTHSIEEVRRHGTAHLKRHYSDCQLLLSVVCYGGKNDYPEQAYRTGADLLGLPRDLGLIAPPQIEFRAVDSALDALASLVPLEKPRLLKAIAACVQADKRITAEEAELFRAIADSLDCPIPPLLETSNA